jgi:hypothetical protein
MYRKLNRTILAAIFVVLLAVVILIELADLRKGGRNFPESLVSVDSGNITSMELFPRVTGGNVIKLIKNGDEWSVESEDKKYRADGSRVIPLVNELNLMSPESVVSVKEEGWEQYEVTDSLGTRVKLFSGSKLLSDLIIGKFSFSQSRKMTSYVRIAGEKEVYGIDGMIGMSFNRNVNYFRDNTVINSPASEWNELSFSYPADSSFVMKKTDDKWIADGQPADSASVAEYLSTLSDLNDSRFAEIDNAGGLTLTHKLVIGKGDGSDPLEISGYYTGGDEFFIESSQNKGALFNSKELADKIFISKKKLTLKE